MTKFRFHRGSLSEAMKTECEVDGMDELLEVLNTTPLIVSGFHEPVDRASVGVEHYSGPDDRIGWKDTWIVTVDRQAWGFTDGEVT